MGKAPLLSIIATQTGKSAVFGFGASAGRDMWKSTKKNSDIIFLFVIFLSTMTFPFLGGRNLTRSYPKNSIWALFKGYFSGLFLIMLGIAIATGAVYLLLLFGLGEITTLFSFSGLRNPDMGFLPFLLVIALELITIPLVLGLIFGLFQRSHRQKLFKIEDKNINFLEKFGLAETGEKEITHVDAQQNPLRVLERTSDAIIFIAVGKRNKRAYIKLAPDGEMIGYTGIVSLSSNRDYIKA